MFQAKEEKTKKDDESSDRKKLMKTALILLAVSTLTVTASDDLQVFSDYSDFNYEDVQVELSGPVLANDRWL